MSRRTGFRIMLDRLLLGAALLIGGAAAAAVQPPATASAESPGLAELRHVIGAWDVRTEFLNPDGSIARAADGTYDFEWALPDAVVRGVARQPELGGASAILFYLRPARGEIEMLSVDRSGTLWIMTGEAGANVRATADRTMSDGTTMRLRFIRFNVAADRFESRMDYSTDGGATWIRGNHQTFVRRYGAEASPTGAS